MSDIVKIYITLVVGIAALAIVFGAMSLVESLNKPCPVQVVEGK